MSQAATIEPLTEEEVRDLVVHVAGYRAAGLTRTSLPLETVERLLSVQASGATISEREGK